ncbi:MAG: tRNA preQ1(34) S-adenosylmethionine ribosyltransferase-isomerase QueA [Elusimicrobiota bacterium]|jgi:S-adenosylmethionine:tRNA ribosyltransferase-isomerase|nr:tRNA preQ1(34) S-adenosylmethionine ribosyltransferase-isomerase QueA [Elusimicrobiota bacterium]
MADNTKFGMNLNEYNFTLPHKLISQKPLLKRDSAKFLIYDVSKDKIYHKIFNQISDYFSENDLIILNDSKVIPAKLTAKINNNTFIEIILIEELTFGENFIDFSIITKLSKIKKNQEFIFKEDIRAIYLGRTKDLTDGILRFWTNRATFYKFIYEFGKMPLPPYIKRNSNFLGLDEFDKKRYQTVYAKNLGSIACPTAGLHFTKDIFENLKKRNVMIKYLTLHVGLGTFRSIKTHRIEEHNMLKEKYEISKEVSILLKNKEKRLTSVGTTTTRTIESFYKTGKKEDFTDLFIYSGHKFIIDRLITNFHVPKSTPLILTVAFLADKIRKEGEVDSNKSVENALKIFKKIYKEAIDKKYRFYSYGDSMMII